MRAFHRDTCSDHEASCSTEPCRRRPHIPTLWGTMLSQGIPRSLIRFSPTSCGEQGRPSATCQEKSIYHWKPVSTPPGNSLHPGILIWRRRTTAVRNPHLAGRGEGRIIWYLLEGRRLKPMTASGEGPWPSDASPTTKQGRGVKELYTSKIASSLQRWLLPASLSSFVSKNESKPSPGCPLKSLVATVPTRQQVSDLGNRLPTSFLSDSSHAVHEPDYSNRFAPIRRNDRKSAATLRRPHRKSQRLHSGSPSPIVKLRCVIFGQTWDEFFGPRDLFLDAWAVPSWASTFPTPPPLEASSSTQEIVSPARHAGSADIPPTLSSHSWRPNEGN